MKTKKLLSLVVNRPFVRHTTCDRDDGPGHRPNVEGVASRGIINVSEVETVPHFNGSLDYWVFGSHRVHGLSKRHLSSH